MNKKTFEEKYKDVELKFSHYYKYKFYFQSEFLDDQNYIIACIGGDSNDIYRLEVRNDEVNLLGERLQAYWDEVSMYDENDKEIFAWYEGY